MVCISQVIYFLAFIALMATITVAWDRGQREEDSLDSAEQNLALRTLMEKAFGKRRLWSAIVQSYFWTKYSLIVGNSEQNIEIAIWSVVVTRHMFVSYFITFICFYTEQNIRIGCLFRIFTFNALTDHITEFEFFSKLNKILE